MIPVLVFTPGRFKQWIVRLARRGKCGVLEIRLRLEELLGAHVAHDDCFTVSELLLGKRNRSAHQENHRRCWRDRQAAKLLRLCYASACELKMVAGRRADALDDALRAVEDTIIGHSSARGVPELQPKEPKRMPYANVGVYDPDEAEPEDDGGPPSESEPCFTFEEYLHFRRLSVLRRLHSIEHRQCRALVETLYRLFVIFDGDVPVKPRSKQHAQNTLRARRKH